MFGVKKEELVKGLCHISCRLCGYMGSICDCKYIQNPEEFGHASEQTGCPETAMAATLINAMTPQEFKRIAKRARIQINDVEEGDVDVGGTMREMKHKKHEMLKASWISHSAPAGKGKKK